MLDLESYIRFIAALGTVLALIGGSAWLLKRYGFERTPRRKKHHGRRLQILETKAIDTRHRLVLLSRDKIEHLVILGPAGESVIESGIKRPHDLDATGQSPGDHEIPAPDISGRGGDLVELYNDGQKPTVRVQSKAGHGGEV